MFCFFFFRSFAPNSFQTQLFLLVWFAKIIFASPSPTPGYTPDSDRVYIVAEHKNY